MADEPDQIRIDSPVTPKIAHILSTRLANGVGRERFEKVVRPESDNDFQPGEWDALLAEGEHSIEEEGTLDGEQAYQLRRAKRKKRFPH